MSNNVTLSAGVRQNLLSLQNTAQLMANTQNRLATGKKVNSALDNPMNFFASQSLGNRAGDLNALLDNIGQAQQNLKAADTGITALTKLVQSAKSIVTQAQQAARGTVNYTGITGTAAIPADTSRTTSASTVAAFTSGPPSPVPSNMGSFQINASSLASLSNNDTLTLKLGSGSTQTFTYKSSGANTAAGEFGTAAELATVLGAAFGAGNVTNTAGTVKVTGTDYTSSFVAGGAVNTTMTAQITNTAAADGDKLTVNDGTSTGTFRYVASGANAANGTFSDAASLVAAINNAASPVSAKITASNASGKLQLDAAGSVAITAGGTIGSALGFPAGATASNYNATLAALNGTLSVQVGSNAATSVIFGTGSGQISTRAGLNAALAAFSNVTGSVDAAGKVDFTPLSSDAVTISGTPATLTGLGLAAGTTTPSATVVTPNAARASLQSDFNGLLSQIDQLAADASYNGINLLNGDDLKVIYNENGTSSLTIQGLKFNAAGLGLTAVAGSGFQDNKIVADTLANIDAALNSLRTQASKFGSNLTTVQTRQDFTKNLINTLQTGADNLVLADTNEEGANLLALQTRQQLSTTALSMASQADQAVLRLFS